jgi:hypothetical protein
MPSWVSTFYRTFAVRAKSGRPDGSYFSPFSPLSDIMWRRKNSS